MDLNLPPLEEEYIMECRRLNDLFQSKYYRGLISVTPVHHYLYDTYIRSLIKRTLMNEWILRSYFDYQSYVQWLPTEIFGELLEFILSKYYR